jgi:hypothetical protein
MKIYTDADDVKRIALAAFPNYSGKRFSIENFAGPMALESYWCGGARDSFAFVELCDGNPRALRVPENGNGFALDGKTLRVDELPSETALVRLVDGAGGIRNITVFLRDENIAKMLPAKRELTFAQSVVLAASVEYKAQFRKEAARRDCGVGESDYLIAKDELAAMGLLNKIGAITNEGRNVNGETRLNRLRAQ